MKPLGTFEGFSLFGVAAAKSFVSCTIRRMSYGTTEGSRREVGLTMPN